LNTDVFDGVFNRNAMMVPRSDTTGRGEETQQSIAYIKQMLGELRQVAYAEGAEMLCYLIEMAYVEAGDLQAGRRQRSIFHRE
jgi:hypothetical protein